MTNVEQKWTVQSKGKWVSVLSFIGVYFFALVFIFLLLNRRHSVAADEAWMSFFLFFPVTFAAFLIPIYYIIKKKVPKHIIITADKEIRLVFSSKKDLRIKDTDLAYCVYNYPMYSVLELYKKSRATRGHMNYFKKFEMMGTLVPAGWTPKLMNEIVTSLENLDIELRSIPDEQSFVSRLFK